MAVQKINQVKRMYASGWKISFEKHSKGPMLFMEWLENEQPKYQYPFDFKISTSPNEEDVLNDLFVIRFSLITRQLIDSCYQYISNNIS